MLYVLNQRLQAQKIATEKSERVLSDIVATMFKSHFLKQMFESPSIYSKPALRNIFKKLIHSSVMRVNRDSMEKLFDLMLMAVKHQVLAVGNPTLLLHVCLNHLDEVLRFVGNTQDARQLVVTAFNKVVRTYGACSMGEMAVIRQRILCFLQDENVKITMYLSQHIQNSMGRFAVPTSEPVPIGFQVPGTIVREKDGQSSSFNVGGHFTNPVDVAGASNKLSGCRATRLGTNAYNSLDTSLVAKQQPEQVTKSVNEPNCSKLATAELDLLSQMLGSSNSSSGGHQFKIDLFLNDDVLAGDNAADVIVEQGQGAAASRTAGGKHGFLNLTPSSKSADHMSKIMKDMDIGSEGDGMEDDDDLLALMDDAC